MLSVDIVVLALCAVVTSCTAGCGERTVTVTFQPTVSRQYFAELQLHSNDRDTPVLSVPLNATLLPSAEFAPSSVRLQRTVLTTSSPTKTINLTNIRPHALNLSVPNYTDSSGVFNFSTDCADILDGQSFRSNKRAAHTCWLLQRASPALSLSPS